MNRTLDGWLTYIGGVHVKDIELGLDRVTEVARRLDVLRPAQRTVIVAGTNGKGSTCVALEQLLIGADGRIGTTLSPHVTRFNERIRIDGWELPDNRLCRLFEEVDSARGELALTYFEFSALAALLAFRQAEVDVAILEVGLGGRLDAFNAVDADLAIVTSIGLDHEDYLGSDLEGIGREKAGVFRPGQAVVLGRVTDSVRHAALELGCSTLELDRDFVVSEDRQGWSYCWDARDVRFEGLRRGALAPSNCALAVTAAVVLRGNGDLPTGVLADASLPGRMETHYLADAQVVLDVAHNTAGAVFLAQQLRSGFPDRRHVAVLGSLTDKDAPGIVSALDELVSDWFTIPTSGPRGQTAEVLAERLGTRATACESISSALDKALSFAGPGGSILVLGSFSAVEQARTLLTDCGEKRG